MLLICRTNIELLRLREKNLENKTLMLTALLFNCTFSVFDVNEILLSHLLTYLRGKGYTAVNCSLVLILQCARETVGI